MPLSARLSLLMLGACFLPVAASASPVLRGSFDMEDAETRVAKAQTVRESQTAPGEIDDPSLADIIDTGMSGASFRRGVSLPPLPRYMPPRAGSVPRPSFVPPRTRAPAASPPAPPPGNTTGANVVVAVVDTGIQTSHSEFAGRIALGGTCFGTASTCAGSAGSGADDQGHGTHVAGIIGAAANNLGTTGIAPGSLLLPVKVLDRTGAGSPGAIAAGISHAALRGARVINLSLGGQDPAPELIPALQTAAKSSVIVAAAGNSGNSLSAAFPAAYATQPGIVGSMIAVGSVSTANRISSFSQTPGTGGCVETGGVSRCLRDVFLVAPGERINSTFLNNSYAAASGTSMAAPHVAGAAALVIGASPFLTSQQVVDILLRSAKDIGAPGPDPVFGRGLLNVNAAMAPLGAQTIATAGGWTSSYSGSGEVSTSSLSGPLGAGVRNATLLRSVTFFDEYGRDYQTDLTAYVAPASVSLVDRISTPSWSSQFISFTGKDFSASASLADGTSNGVMSLSFTDDNGDRLSDLVIKARLSDVSGVSVGHNASVQGLANRLDLAADPRFEGLFVDASALNSPFLSLADGGNIGLASVRLGGQASLSFGHARVEAEDAAVVTTSIMASDAQLVRLTDPVGHTRAAQTSFVALDWTLAPWAMTGIVLGMIEEENSLLGTSESGALALTSDASTLSVGGSARFDLGQRVTLSAAWSFGRTEAAPEAGSIVQSYSEISSHSYGIAISREGLFSDGDSIGFAVSRPLHITQGTASLLASTGVTDERGIVYTQETLSLASATPETDVELGYTTFLSLDTMLMANLIYQQNVGGEAGENAIAGLVTIKTRW